MDIPRDEEGEELLHPAGLSSNRRQRAFADGQVNIGHTRISKSNALVQADSSSKDKENKDKVDDVLDDLRNRISRDMKKHDVSFDEIFDEFDENHDGLLSMKEIQAGIEKVGITIDSEEATKIVDKFSNDGGKTVKYKDFLKAMAPDSTVKEYMDEVSGIVDVIRKELKAGSRSPSEIKAVFGKADTNGDNLMSSKEFALAMKTFDIRIRPRDIEAVYNKFDVDKDDQLDYVEFLGFLGYTGVVKESSASRRLYFIKTTQFLRDTYLGEVAASRERPWQPAFFCTAGDAKGAAEDKDAVPASIAEPPSAAQPKGNHYGVENGAKNSKGDNEHNNRK